MNVNSQVPVVICIDVEPDERIVDRSAAIPWEGLEHSYEFFSQLRPRLVSATGSPVHYSWFFRMDPQIADVHGSAAWPMLHYRDYVADFAKQGDEIGLHTHAWRWDEIRKSWVADHGTQSWVDHCVRVSMSAFGEAIGRGPASFRFGDRWMNNATMRMIDNGGVRFDLTLEPGQTSNPYHEGELYTGSVPDYTEVPRVPYRPSTADFQKPDPHRQRGIWVIPISSGIVAGRLEPLRRLRRIVLARPEEHRRYHTLGMWQNPRAFCSVMDRLLETPRAPHLAFVVRSDLPLRPAFRHMREIFERLLTHRWIRRFVFSTPEETMAQLGEGCRD